MEEARIKQLLSIGVTPMGIMHGYIKELMYDTQCLEEKAEGNKEYLEGRMDALVNLYDLNIKLSFHGRE